MWFVLLQLQKFRNVYFKKRAFATDCTNEILFWFLMFAFGDLLHN